MYDVVIIGAGPAGMSAALYTSRANLSTLLIERELPGGQLNNTETIENYLGTPKADAADLATTMYQQATSFGAELLRRNIKEIIKQDDGLFKIETRKKTIMAKSIILATGTKYRKLGVPGEEEFDAKGVSYCAICDGPFFQDKEIIVVGGGDSALEEADYLTQFSSKVSIVHRRDSFRAKPHLQERVRNNPKIKIFYNAQVEAIKGDDNVNAVELYQTAGDVAGYFDVPASAVFPYIGQLPQQVKLVDEDGKELPLYLENGFLSTDKRYQTAIEGLYAIGDILDKPIRQVANAVGEGAEAAQHVYEYLQ